MEIPDSLLEKGWTIVKVWLCFAKNTDEDGCVLISDEEVAQEAGIDLDEVRSYKDILLSEEYLPCKGVLPSVKNFINSRKSSEIQF